MHQGPGGQLSQMTLYDEEAIVDRLNITIGPLWRRAKGVAKEHT